MMAPEALTDISVSDNNQSIRLFSRLKTWYNVFEKFNNCMKKVIKLYILMTLL